MEASSSTPRQQPMSMEQEWLLQQQQTSSRWPCIPAGRESTAT